MGLRKILDSPWFYRSLAGLLLVAAVVSQFEFTGSQRPEGAIEEIVELKDRERLNVIFIVIDMLRADRLTPYGYERDTSPIMNELADQGILFKHVESQSSWTKASMASMWTGMYPQRTGVLRYTHVLPPEARMPAEIFRDAGYRTGGVWRNGWVANNFGFDQGFELYIRPRPNARPNNLKRHNPSAHALTGTDLDATESAIEFMVNNHEEPFFLYVHYMDVHQYLYADVSPDFGTSFSDIYDSSIYWTDVNIGYIFGALADLGLMDNTLVVIASDHGEAFFEHGDEGHARSLYRETQEVPLIMIPPFRLDPGVVVNERIANVDIWPTILDIAGLDPLEAAEGRSLVPEILAAAKEPSEDLGDRALFSQLDSTWGKSYGDVGNKPNHHIAMVKGPYRLIYHERFPKRVELFDRTDDALERRNIASDNVEVAGEMAREVVAFLEPTNSIWGETPEVELDEMHLHQLRALGYEVGGGDEGGMKPLAERLENDADQRQEERFIQPEAREKLDEEPGADEVPDADPDADAAPDADVSPDAVDLENQKAEIEAILE